MASVAYYTPKSVDVFIYNRSNVFYQWTKSKVRPKGRYKQSVRSFLTKFSILYLAVYSERQNANGR